MQWLPLPRSVFPQVGLLTVMLVTWLTWGSFRNPETFWAPGDLSHRHAAIGRCTTCHEPFMGPQASHCLACHMDVTVPVALRPDRNSCLQCHMEHRGRSGNVTIQGQANPH